MAAENEESLAEFARNSMAKITQIEEKRKSKNKVSMRDIEKFAINWGDTKASPKVDDVLYGGDPHGRDW